MIEFQPQNPVMSQEAGIAAIKSGQQLSRTGLQALLESLAPEPSAPASCLYIAPGAVESALEFVGPEGQAWLSRLSSLGRRVLESDTGLACLRRGDAGLVVLPPFPIAETRLIPAWDLSPLHALLAAGRTVGVVLVRLGRFSVAVYRGEGLVSSKTDARYVKGRHQAGGTSQLRYQRIREGQARKLHQKACEAVQSQFSQFDSLDFILLGGDRFTLDGLLRECPYLQQRRDKILGRRLNVRDPKRDTLEAVGRMLTSSKVYPLEW